MKITIDVLRQAGTWGRRIKSPETWAKKIIRSTLKPLVDQPVIEVAVVLSDDAHIRDLNHTYRGKNKATNVLSFPFGESSPVLGDIVLAEETIAREAKAQGKTFHDHATHLLVHGVLHLLGHDHMQKREADIMENMEIQILKRLGIANPY